MENENEVTEEETQETSEETENTEETEEVIDDTESEEPNEMDGLNTQITDLTGKVDELTRANTGIKSDLEAERGRRRDSEGNAAQPAMTPEEQVEYLEEPMTRQEALNLQDSIRNEIKQSTRPLTENSSLVNAKKNHEDFDEVAKLADEVLKKDPYLQAALNLSGDPSEMKYTFGKTHPKYIEGIMKKGKTDTLNTITNPKIKTSANVSGVGGTDLSDIDMATAAKLQENDPEAFAKLPEATRIRIMGAL